MKRWCIKHRPTRAKFIKKEITEIKNERKSKCHQLQEVQLQTKRLQQVNQHRLLGLWHIVRERERQYGRYTERDTWHNRNIDRWDQFQMVVSYIKRSVPKSNNSSNYYLGLLGRWQQVSNIFGTLMLGTMTISTMTISTLMLSTLMLSTMTIST